jgi:hypothetical protein
LDINFCEIKKMSGFLSKFKEKYEEIKTDVKSKTEEIKTDYKSKKEEIKTDFKSKTQEIKTNLSKKIEEVKQDSVTIKKIESFKLMTEKVDYNPKIHIINYESLFTVDYMKKNFEEFLKSEINEAPYLFNLAVRELDNTLESEKVEEVKDIMVTRYLNLIKKYILEEGTQQINISGTCLQEVKEIYKNGSDETIETSKKLDSLKTVLNKISKSMYTELYLDSVGFPVITQVSKIRKNQRNGRFTKKQQWIRGQGIWTILGNQNPINRRELYEHLL